MTELLEKAFRKASQLPEGEQNTLARWLLEEIESDRKWQEDFIESADVLDCLANETLDAYKQGKIKNLTIEKL